MEIIKSNEISNIQTKVINKQTIDFQKVIDDLQKNIENQDVLMGKLISVATIGEVIIANVKYNDLTVMIPVSNNDDKFFEKEYYFGKGADKESLFGRKIIALKEQLNSTVPFIVEKASIKKGNPYIVASKVKANALLRDYYYDDEKTKIGDIVNASVLSVRENNFLVNVRGVETRINAYNLGYSIDNCKKLLYPGDEIEVKVMNIKRQENKPLYVRVSAKTSEKNEDLSTIKVGATYLGKVDHFNSKKDLYTIYLVNGVSVVVHQDNVYRKSILQPNDNVAVKIYDKKDYYCIGSCQKL